MGRPRKKGNKDLPTGLYRDSATGVFYIKWKGKQLSLETKDKKEALELYAIVRAKWEEQDLEKQATRIAARLKRIIVVGRDKSFADYCAYWRKKVLPRATKKNGKPLAPKTRGDYGRMLRYQVEPSEHFATGLSEVSAKLLRKFLSQWLNNPSYYNYVKAVLSKVLETAVDEGLLERNPATDISNRRVPKRDVYLPDNDYIPIMQKLLEEWHVQTCELIYLVSHNPVDVLLLRDANDIKGNKIHITRSKTEQDVVIEMNEDLAATVEWFRRWKRRQGITSPYLICHPLDAPRRSMISQPVSVEYISRRFTQAAIAAGFKPGTYTLRDLRAKGLTDEFEIAGDSDKGGHKTEAMKRYYRRIKSPMRAKSNLNKKLS